MPTLTETQRKTLEKLYDGKMGREMLAEKSGVGIYQCRQFIHRKKPKNVETTEPTLKEEASALVAKSQEKQSSAARKALLIELAETQGALDAALAVKFTPYKEQRINIQHDLKRSTSAVMLLSDWHVDEVVDPRVVNHLNRYDATVAGDSVRQVFANGIKLVKKEQHGARINELVVALLGDLLSGTIHEELLENNSCTPIEALLILRDMASDGINHILQNFDGTVRVVCCVGNHSRTTKKIRHATQVANSYEFILYRLLQQQFSREKRISFVVERGYMCYQDIAGNLVRFHHGHACRYNGGIGGLTIPLNKAIAQWNKSRRAVLDAMGHFHTQMDGGSFVVNGSVVGYNAFAIGIGAGYEPPRQMFFLMDQKYGKTVTAPIHIDRAI